MTKNYVDEFINRALSSGVPREKIAHLLQKADEIVSRGTGQSKIAGDYLDQTVATLLKSTGFDKTASSVAFTHGLIKSALDSGATPAEAITISKEALQSTYNKLAHMQKISEINQDPALANYADGFVKAAIAHGYSEQDAWASVINLIDNEKLAAHGSGDMFKQDAGGGSPGPGMDPSAGGDPTGGAGGSGQPSEEDVVNLLQSLPPEEQQQVLQQFLAMISGGQGGPAGAGAGGPAMPPQGGGASGGLPPTGPGGQ